MNGRDVFINCPFDDSYKPIFQAIVFTVYELGFTPRCALEADDASVGRLAKIMDIIGECGYGGIWIVASCFPLHAGFEKSERVVGCRSIRDPRFPNR